MKIMKKVLILATVAALCLVLLTGCGSTDGDTGAAGDGEVRTEAAVDINNGDAATISYIPMSAGQEDFAVIVEGMQEALGCYPNVTLTTYDPGFDATTQIELINECITQGVDCIIINSMDSTALNSAIAEAEAAGVTVLSMNNGCEGTHTGHIMNADYLSGYEAAEYIDDLVGGEGNVVILDVNATLKATCQMGTAFEDYIAETGHMTLLEDVNLDLTNVEMGYKATAEMLVKYDDIDVIYAVNDNCAIGAYQAIEAAGRQDDGIIVWGFTGTPAALDAISKGNIYGTTYTDPYYEGYAVIVSALYNIQTASTANTLNIDFVPSVMLPTTIVTADNVADIIKGTHWDMSDYSY